MSLLMLEGVDRRLIDFAHRNGLRITAGRNGKHNVGSKHYAGEAIDVSARHVVSGFPLSEQFIAHLARDAEQHGLKLRDERERPAGQKVWGGPHLHIEVVS